MEKDLLQVNETQKSEMRKAFNKTENEIQDYIKIFRTWIQQNPHLPNFDSDERLLKFLQLNKFHLEKTKMKFDNYYTFRRLIPEIFNNREPLHPSMQNLMDVALYLPLPKLQDHSRVHVCKILNDDPKKFIPYDFLKFTIAMVEIRLNYDYCLSDSFIFDLKNTKIGHFTKITPMMLKHTKTIVEKALSDRGQGIHFINAPSYAMNFINLCKTIFKEKIAKRIHVHKDILTLQDHISKKVLPVDYDGTERSIKELQDLWRKFLAENNDWFLNEGRIQVNEKLRSNKIMESELLGYQGSFRKLNLD